MKPEEGFVHAARQGDIGAVRRLLLSGVSADASDKRRTALDWSIFCNYPEVVHALLEAGADPEQRIGEYRENLPLRFASTRGTSKIVDLLLNAGAQPDGRLDDQQGTPLSMAAGQGHLEIVEALLNRGASLNGLGGPQSDPLGSAAWSGQVDVVRFLLGRGATPTPESFESVRRGQETAEKRAKLAGCSVLQLKQTLAPYRVIAELMEQSA
ncbi:ankyrin repeat domain-containing protein [Streptomyces sp. 8L]|uniref:ankyrin repeat domain-containing protein n=1 Tax=Streptomyces sp. 8L TaxID=2877242 RepID=UPI001CD48062|nr:ankyrin repeat domain-containing protein [Streptomyces sp. 8L]MCA1220377.1 ankyrin repeat domain-containing protein [Streptomyces sp. 8L]